MKAKIGMLATGCLLLMALPAVAEVVKLEIITEIRPPHIQAGEKSRQAISIDLARNTHSVAVITGVTELFGRQWASIRDKFELTAVTLGNPRITFTAQGQTASPVRVMPDIDYKFSFILNRAQKKFWISGCHNRFPSYRILINGASIYDQPQVGNAFTGLIGVCHTITNIEGSY